MERSFPKNIMLHFLLDFVAFIIYIFFISSLALFACQIQNNYNHFKATFRKTIITITIMI